MKKGFTLVELAIVLVIIGLLIGGVISAQSMIQTARVTSQAAQIGQFDAGVMNFKERYNYLPGDAPAFGGDGNGLVGVSPSLVISGIDIFSCEIADFWANLFSGEYATTGCTATGATSVLEGSGKNVPTAKLGKQKSYFVVSAAGTTASCSGGEDTANPRNIYSILNAPVSFISGRYRFVATTTSNSSLKPSEMLALDRKIDDAIADTGYYVSGAVCDEGTGSGHLRETPLATCSSGASYQVQNAGYECTPLIRIGGRVGDPQ